MLTVTEIEPRVWEVRLSGRLDAADIKTMERVLIPALGGEGKLGLVVRAEDWTDISADAIAEDMRFEFGLLTKWNKIARVAVVSDLEAFAAIIRWTNPIVPMTEMRAFGSSEVARARAFASSPPEPQDGRIGRGVTLLPNGGDGVLACEVDGRIMPEDIDTIMAALEARMEHGDPVNVLVHIKGWSGFDPAILTHASLMRMKWTAMTRLRRYAVIGAPDWMRSIAGGMTSMVPFEMRLFEQDEDAEAWAWVRDG